MVLPSMLQQVARARASVFMDGLMKDFQNGSTKAYLLSQRNDWLATQSGQGKTDGSKPKEKQKGARPKGQQK